MKTRVNINTSNILLLMVLMVFISINVQAQNNVWNGDVANAFSGGNGTAGSPYTISNGEELAFLAKNVNSGETYSGKFFQISSDIDLGGVKWTPIGDDKNQFRGSVNGLNHLITNLYINEPTMTNVGLFGYIGTGGEIHHLAIVGTSNVTGGESVGAIVGRSNGSVYNCYTTVNITGNQGGKTTEVGAGGIVGFNNGTIKVCYSVGRVSGGITGGICGWDWTTNDDNVRDCFFDNQVATIESNNPRAVGNKNNNNTRGGKSTVDMTTGLQWTIDFLKSEWYMYYGIYPQFAGMEGTSLSKISVSPVFLSNGEGVNSVKSSFNVSVVNDCVWSIAKSKFGSVIIDGDNAIVERPTADNDTVYLRCTHNNSFKDFRIVIQKIKCNIKLRIAGNGVVKHNETELKNGDFITVEDGSVTAFTVAPDNSNYLSVFKFGKNNVTPTADYDKNRLDYHTPQVFTDTEFTIEFAQCQPWDGSTKQPFTDASGSSILVYTPEELAYISKTSTETGDFTGVRIKLLNDIDLGGNAEEIEDKKNWIPIGMPSGQNKMAQFNGVFDGNDKKINNIYAYLTSKYYVGLFSVIGSNGNVFNTTILSGEISGLGWVGAIAGENRGNISNCSNASLVTGYEQKTGGVVGFNNGGKIEHCSNWNRVMGRIEVGGVIGYNYNANVNKCENYAEVSYISGSNSRSLGGVIGRDNSKDRTIENCYNSGNIKGMNYCGGIVGKNMGAYINSCTNLGTVNGRASVGGIAGELSGGGVSDSYNRANITGTKDTIGGVVGDNYARNITRSFNSGQVTGMNSVGGIAGVNEGSISYCYNTNEVSGSNYLGGIAGQCLKKSSTSQVYNNSCVTGSSYLGAITGSAFDGSFTLDYCRYDKNTCSLTASASGDTPNAIGISTAELKTRAFTNSPWMPDFTQYSVNNGYPILNWQGNSTGVNSVEPIEYNVYPNPVQNVVNIEGDEILNVRIVDMSGRLISSHDYFDNKVTINLDNLKRGIYVLNITGKGGVSCTKKIVKQ